MDWLKSDKDKALWKVIRRREACGGCGTRPEEHDPERGGDPNAYVAVVERCRGCELRAAAEASREYKEGGRGLHIVLKRRKR